MPGISKTIIPAVVVCSCALVTGCGGGSAKPKTSAAHSTATQTSSTPTAADAANQKTAGNVVMPQGAAAELPVAIVDGKPISGAELERSYVVKLANQAIADAPDYTNCIKRLKAEAEKRSGERIAGEAELRRMCTAGFEEEHAATALAAAIHNRWLLGEAAEEGLSVSNREVEQELAQDEKSLGSHAKLEAYLKSTKRTLPEVKAELKANKLANAIFRRIEDKSHAAAATEVSSYYAEHARQFTIPQGRRVRIVRTATAASAATAKQQLLSGKSFAQVAKQLSAIGQPISAKNGEVADLKEHFFEERPLNDAIFSAQLNRIYGPIKLTARHKTIAPETNSGYFIFEVKGIVPARPIPLAKVKASIAEQLTKQQKSQSLAAFVKAFRSKWKARTNCLPGYVLTRLCRQYKPKAGESEDPYTL